MRWRCLQRERYTPFRFYEAHLFLDHKRFRVLFMRDLVQVAMIGMEVAMRYEGDDKRLLTLQKNGRGSDLEYYDPL